MSLSSAFKDWCQHHQYNPTSATYIAHGLTDLRPAHARIVRGVAPADRAAKHRSPQKYTVEVMLNDALTYPLGTDWLSQQQLLAALVADRWKGQEQ